ncbi:MAG: hypothetical protein AAB842_00970 [Patescibacteria group bacterium]
MPKQDLTKEKIETGEEEEVEENPNEEDSRGGQIKEEQPSFWKGFATPEGIFMMGLALIVDVLEIVLDLTGVGAIVQIAIDIAAFLIIGGWMMSHGSDIKAPQKAVDNLKKAGKKQFETASAKWAKRLKWMRFSMPIFELIPFISIVPMWVVGVYYELKYGGKN